MSLDRTFKVLRKDLFMSPRNSIFFFALAMPVILTLLFQLVFGSLFDPEPRLGIVDYGDSEMTAEAQEIEGVETTVVDDEQELMTMVEENDLDAGLVLEDGFDEAVKAGEQPQLGFFIGGESLASDRIILSVTTIDLVRGVEGESSPVEVEVTSLGEELLPISTRLIPSLVMYALIVAGVFVPAFYVVAERESKTLEAVLVTPVKFSEFLSAKAIFGFGLAFFIAIATLALNGALGSNYLALIAAMAVACLMSVEIGMIYATGSSNIRTLYTFIKTLNIFIFAPVIFYIFPDWPQWIAKLFPTYWFINPIWDVTIRGEGLADVGGELLVALAICAALLVPIYYLARRMQNSIAIS
jgi:ABC-2 type transport system permease protein